MDVENTCDEKEEDELARNASVCDLKSSSSENAFQDDENLSLKRMSLNECDSPRKKLKPDTDDVKDDEDMCVLQENEEDKSCELTVCASSQGASSLEQNTSEQQKKMVDENLEHTKKEKQLNSNQYNLRKKKDEPVKQNESVSATTEENLENELDEILEEKAWKNNLSAINVKNILRHVITNKHVLAMVHNTMSEGNAAENLEESIYEPKLTRSKTKELIEKQVNIPWPISPIKKPPLVSSSCNLMETEFSEEENSSDEEYTPGIEISDEDENQSLNRSTEVEPPESPSKSEAPIKIDDVAPTDAESDTIAFRTRSKLPLVDTPLEIIEATLTAPDITTDMYDSECDDEEWKNFLKDFVLPQDQTTTVDGGDDETEDPEYNFLEEEEEVDREDMRDDRAVKIPKKELGELMAELFESGFMDWTEYEDDDEMKRNQTIEDRNGEYAVGRAHELMNEMTTSSEIPSAFTVTAEERLQLEEQMRKHVQLLTQGYILSSSVTELKDVAEMYKTLLIELQTFGIKNTVTSSQMSSFNAFNLTDSITLISNYKEVCIRSPKKINSTFKKGLKDKLLNGFGLSALAMKTISEEKVFIYPELLPVCGFFSSGQTKTFFTEAENNLIILGLEQFFNLKEHSFTKLIHTHMLPVKTEHQIRLHIKNLKSLKAPDNPIKSYFQNKTLPVIKRQVTVFNSTELKPPSQQPIDRLPQWLQKKIRLLSPRITAFSNIRMLPPKSDSLLSPSRSSSLYLPGRVSDNLIKRTISGESREETNANKTVLHIVEKSSSVCSESIIKCSATKSSLDSVVYVPSTISNEVATVSVLTLHPSSSVNGNEKNGVSLLNSPEKSSKDSLAGRQLSLIVPSPTAKRVSPLKHVSPILKKYSPKKMRKTGGNLKRTLPILPKTIQPTTIFISQPRRKKNSLKVLAPKIQEPKNEKEVNMEKSIETRNVKISSKEEKPVQSKEPVSKKEQGDSGKALSPHSVEDILSPIEIDSQSDNELFEDEEVLDNAEDLAALMAASTTIKSTPRGRQHSLTRKANRQQRDLELVEMLAPDLVESDPLREEKESAIANAYLAKVKEATKDNEEIFMEFLKLLHDFGQSDKSVVQLHRNVCKLLKPYPQICDEFAMFLLPEQAMECGKLTQYLQFMDMRLFLRKIEIHFRKHPQHIQKILKVLMQCEREAHLGMDHIKNLIQPLFRNQSHLMEEFLHLFPDEHPPESLMTDFEEVTLPDSDAEIDDDGFEVVTLPEEEDEYGGKNCKCSCHSNSQDLKMQNRVRHCFHCGIKFIDGRVYIQSGKTLKPVHIEYINPEDKKYALSQQEQREGSLSSKTCPNVLSPLVTQESDVVGDNPPSPCFESSSVSSLSPTGGKESEEEKDSGNATEKGKHNAPSNGGILLEALEHIAQNPATNLPLPSGAVTEDAILTPGSSQLNANIPQDFSVLHVVLNPCNLQESLRTDKEGGGGELSSKAIQLSRPSSSPQQAAENKEPSQTSLCSSQTTLMPMKEVTFLNLSNYSNALVSVADSSNPVTLVTSANPNNSPDALHPTESGTIPCWNFSPIAAQFRMDTAESSDKDQCGISAKNHSVDEKGEVVVLWTRDADRLILSTCQQMGPTESAFQKIASDLQNKTIPQVKQRFTELISLFSQQQSK